MELLMDIRDPYDSFLHLRRLGGCGIGKRVLGEEGHRGGD